MNNKAIVEFYDLVNKRSAELEIPIDITANDLIIALNEAYGLGMDIDNIFNCSLIAENPIAFLKGNKLLSVYGIRNGSKIIFKRS